MSSPRRRLRRAAFFLVGSLLLLATALVVRLASGPIDLEPLRPHLERSLGAPDGSFRVHLAALQVAWDRRAGELALRATNLRVVARGGETLAEVPVVAVRLAAGALLRGRIVPAEVRIVEPRLMVVRAADGTLDLSLGAGVPGSGEPADLGAIVDVLARGGGAGAPSLRRLSARGGEIALLDQRSGRTSRLTGAELVLEPSAQGLAGSLAGRLETAPHAVPIRVGVRYRRDSGRGVVRLAFRRLPPEMIGDLPIWSDDAAARQATGVLRMPLDGTIVLDVDSGFRPTVARGHARGGAGELRIASDVIDPIALTGLRVRGRLDPAARRLDVPRLSLALGPSRVHAAGSVSWAGDGVAIDAETTVEALPLDNLGRWWPPNVAPAARRWVVERRSGGTVTKSELELHATVDGGSHHAAVRVPRATIGFEGVSVDYHEHLPAVTGLAGKAHLDDRGWTVQATRGRLGAIELVAASGALPVPGRRPSRPHLAAELRGTLPEVVAILDREPFGYASALGITPAAVAGTVTAHLAIDGTRAGSELPVAVSGTARLGGVATHAIAGGLALSDGDILLEFEPGRVRANGTARLEGTPMTFTWNENPSARTGRARDVSVRSRLDSEGRRRLGLDLMPWLDGPIDVEARLATTGGNGGVDVQVRLDDAKIAPGFEGLAKPAGAPGRADARLTLAENGLTGIERLTVEAGPATVTGTASRGTAGWDRAQLQASIATPSGGVPGRCVLAVERQQSGHHFRLTSDDAGTLLLSIFGDRHLHGGRLTFDGQAVPSGAHPVVAGSLDVRDVVLVKAPVLARVARVASLTGILDTLDRSGLVFDRAQAELRYAQPALSIVDGLASGPGLAFALDGTIDRVAATADLRGTAVPSYYGLNTAPGRIPVLGKVVGDKGIQAIDFTVTGALADPQVKVAPVSALLPGRLRDVVRRFER
jgi:uncharacterized protein YhdP